MAHVPVAHAISDSDLPSFSDPEEKDSSIRIEEGEPEGEGTHRPDQSASEQLAEQNEQPEDPWGLALTGQDPDGPIQAAPSPKSPKPDIDPKSLDEYEARAYRAIVEDPALAAITKNPADTARRLVRIAPAVDVPLEIASLGTWLVSNPAKAKKNGAAFLTRNIGRKQEQGGTRGYVPRDSPTAGATSPRTSTNGQNPIDAHAEAMMRRGPPPESSFGALELPEFLRKAGS